MAGTSRTSSRFVGQYNRYRLINAIASDNVGTFWSAEDTALRRPVTVRVFSDSLSQDERFVDEFRRGLRAAFPLLDHPSVAQVINYNYGEDGPTQFAVMEPIQGETLGQRLQREGTLSPMEALRISSGVADALRAAHRLELVHGGVRPHNIMLTSDGHIKVMDFGTADVATRVSSGGADGEPTGYTAPELARGGEPSPASDVYALGVLLYRTLTGRTPSMERSTLGEGGEPPALSPVMDDLIPLIGNSAAQICKRALDSDPESRPSISRIAWALREALEEAPKRESTGVAPAPLEAEGLQGPRFQEQRLEEPGAEVAPPQAERDEAAPLEETLHEVEEEEAGQPEPSPRQASRREARRQRREEKARLKEAKREAERQEAARLEAERQEASRREAERKEAQRQEAARKEKERKETERFEKKQRKQARKTARREAREEKARQKAARREQRKGKPEAALPEGAVLEETPREEGTPLEAAGRTLPEDEPSAADDRGESTTRLRRRMIVILSVGSAIVVALALVIVARSL